MTIEQLTYYDYYNFVFLLLIFNNKQFPTTQPHIPLSKSAFYRSLNAALAAGNSPLLHVHWMITPVRMHVCLILIQLTERLFHVYSC